MRTKNAIPICIGINLACISTTLLAEPALLTSMETLSVDEIQIDGQTEEKNRITETTNQLELPKSINPLAPSPEKETVESTEIWKEFSSRTQNKRALNIGEGFSNALGWVLWKSEGISLNEVTNVNEFENPDAERSPLTWVMDPGTKKLRKVTAAEYTAWGPQTRLGMYRETDGERLEEGNAVMMSVRDSFSYFTASQEGFGIDFTEQNGESELKIKGAVMVDVYLDALYNRKGEQHDKDTNPYRFWFRTGVEFDRDDSADQPTDRTSYYLLTNFQANPNQSAKLLGQENIFRVLSPQFLQVGAAFDHDEMTGENDMRWIIGWQPQFYAYKDLPFIAETFGINRTMFFEKAGLFSFNLLTPKEAIESDGEKASNFYSSLPMDIRLSGGSEILAEAFDQDADSADEALLEWKAGVLFGYGPIIAKKQSSARWRIGYFAEGASPVLDPSETHMGHRVVAEVGLGNLSKEYIDQQTANNKAIKSKKGSFEFTALPTTAMGAMTVFAEYRFGAPPPSYTKDEMFLVGTRIRF